MGVHLAAADSKEQGPAPGPDAVVELSHDGVEVVAHAARLRHHRLRRRQLAPHAGRLQL